MIVLTNGKIVTESAILVGYDLVIKEDRIDAIVVSGSRTETDEHEVINAHGGYIAPGFIDLHSDYIEHMAAPRPTCLVDFTLGLRECEKELITHGVTTMYHSLSLFKTSEFSYKPIREPENVKKLVDLIQITHAKKHLIRHRFHARYEIDNLEQVDNLKSYIAQGKVHLLSFMDHSPGQGQYRDLEIYRKTLKGYSSLSEQALDGIIAYHGTKEKLSYEGICEIAQLAKSYHIAIASHDDDSTEKLELVKSFGATISEFPITMEVARSAKAMGLYTLAGAPNILLGGSHSGNLSATEAIAHNLVDIICSDYYPAALLHAVFQLHKTHGMDLVEAMKLVTLNPAKAVLADHEIGSLEVGKKADIILIESIEDDFPVITTTIVDGRIITRTNYR